MKTGVYYGWIIVAGFIFIQTVMMGIHTSFSVFFKSIETEFTLSRTVTSSIISLSMILIPLFAFIGGWALDKYGPRKVVFCMGLFFGLSMVLTSQINAAWQLFITYSILQAAGMGAIYAVVVSTISRWFNKNRGLAVGISGSGEGLGAVTMAPFSTFLISMFNWKTAYLILGIISWVVIIPLSLLLRREPKEMNLLPDGVSIESSYTVIDEKSTESLPGNGQSLSEILKLKSFWTASGVWLCLSFSMLLVLTHFVPHATDVGLSESMAALVLGVMGAARAAGTIVLGIISDKVGRKKVAIVSSFIISGSLLWLIWVREPWMFFLFAIVNGIANGGLFSGFSPLLGDVFGLQRIGTILGLMEIGWGIGAASGPLLGGYIFDTSASYSLAFILSASVMIMITLLIGILKPEYKSRNLGTAVSPS